MTKLLLNGRITESGKLQVDLPAGLPAGEARVTLEIDPLEDWSAEELDQALEIHPKSGHEIVASGLLGGWADQGIVDADQWLAELRQRRRADRPLATP